MMCPLAESLNKINAVSQVQADGKQELYYLHIGSPSTLACTEVPGSEVIHVVHFLNVCVDSGGSGGDAGNLNSSGGGGGVCVGGCGCVASVALAATGSGSGGCICVGVGGGVISRLVGGGVGAAEGVGLGLVGGSSAPAAPPPRGWVGCKGC